MSALQTSQQSPQFSLIVFLQVLEISWQLILEVFPIRTMNSDLFTIADTHLSTNEYLGNRTATICHLILAALQITIYVISGISYCKEKQFICAHSLSWLVQR